MTLDEAIEQSKEGVRYLTREHHDIQAKGVVLGIEALKRLKGEKDTIPDALWNPLPGETEN